MPVHQHERPTETGAFPSSGHFPLGRRFGMVDTAPEPASPVRPFGLTLGTRPRQVTPLNPADIGYDEDAQMGLMRDDGGQLVPMSRHTDGQTNTVTDGGDGRYTNKDSDTDHRED
ncbi:putative ATP-grasp-modified RiPP [Amycolatopsis cihanbeyliensis]|uniref:Putative ATP-grasp target RiPP n=1 Tax=Amycolatopsis cihanbeyliensis TaxID=1128664 RepID=A0A542DI12_AMYCI|nr:putative ATP-grasp-modified RiPP [Amycolatopsis cihanbeyliensis]TQJ02690.1 putative ATP-grasp target RiPP [Amycolatopsis cihanbeyliensis]